MKIRVSQNLRQNLYVLLRRCGYMPIHDRISGNDSFIRKLTNQRYPRFHLYISEEEKTNFIFDLHLDQSSTRYDGQTAHNADHESEEVKNELIRIYQAITK